MIGMQAEDELREFLKAQEKGKSLVWNDYLVTRLPGFWEISFAGKKETIFNLHVNRAVLANGTIAYTFEEGSAIASDQTRVWPV